MVCGNAVMTGECEFESAAEACPMDADNDRLRESGDALQHLLPFGGEPLGLRGRAERAELLDVGPREEIVGLAGEGGDRTHPGIVRQRREARTERLLLP